LEIWEFIHSRAKAPDAWRWRKRGSAREILAESPRFTLFMQCVAHARDYGFDFTGHSFQVVEEQLHEGRSDSAGALKEDRRP
jgi:hypothetical protein